MNKVLRYIKSALKNRKKRATIVLLLFLIVGIFHPFIANERPLICKINNKTYFPIFRSIGHNLKLVKPYSDITDHSWRDKNYKYKIMPLIPYSYNTLDNRNASFRSPFDARSGKSIFQKHWLGTDIVGRDTLAGILKGTETAIIIAVLSVGLAIFLALVFGIFAAFSKRFPLYVDIIYFPIILIIGIIGSYYLWLFLQGSVTIFLIFVLLLGVIMFLLRRFSVLPEKISGKQIRIPVDSIFMRIVEAMKTIPSLVFLLAIIAILDSVNRFTLVLILGFLMWPGIARHVRAETIKILNLDYITAAEAYGATKLRMVLKHVLPKLFTNLSVLFAFGISAVILVEATLAFLGFGLPIDQVSWGMMMKESRQNISAWWLAVFPGIALYFLIYNLNVFAEELQLEEQL